MPRTNRFGAPVFYKTENLIKHVTQQDNMEWTSDDRELYEETWQNQSGDLLYIEDATQILSPTEQTHLTNFDEDRYRVLEQGRYQPESSLQETFQKLDDALEYVENNYGIHL